MLTHQVQITLTNSPIPVTSEDSDKDEVLPHDQRHQVVHGDLQAYQVPVSLEGAIMGQDVPLVTFKLTNMKKTGETVLGLSWNHVLGVSVRLILENDCHNNHDVTIHR